MEYCYNCSGKLVVKKNQSYRYDVESGVDNVKLLGVDLHVCQSCGDEMASIPCMTNLHAVMAATFITRLPKSPEQEFLRKELKSRARCTKSDRGSWSFAGFQDGDACFRWEEGGGK